MAVVIVAIICVEMFVAAMTMLDQKKPQFALLLLVPLADTLSDVAYIVTSSFLNAGVFVVVTLTLVSPPCY